MKANKHHKQASILLLLLTLSIGLVVQQAAAQPGWSVNPGDYQYSMTVTAFLSVDGNTLTSDQDMVAAFAGSEVRGVANVIYVSNADRYLAFLTVYANQENEPISFQIYDSGSGRIVTATQQLDFKIDAQYGNLFQAYSIADPPLRSEAAIETFSFTNASVLSSNITTGSVELVVGNEVDVSALVAQFEVSPGARMYRNRILQTSGAEAVDFSDAVVYAVLSEDESVLNEYTVEVKHQSESSISGFSSTNVITANHDGANDYWIVQDAYLYDGFRFQIFDINGRIVYESVGYENDWDGTYRGKPLDTGKYYYVVSNPETGTRFEGEILILY